MFVADSVRVQRVSSPAEAVVSGSVNGPMTVTLLDNAGNAGNAIDTATLT